MVELIESPDAATGTTTALEHLRNDIHSFNNKIEQAIIKIYTIA